MWTHTVHTHPTVTNLERRQRPRASHITTYTNVCTNVHCNCKSALCGNYVARRYVLVRYYLFRIFDERNSITVAADTRHYVRLKGLSGLELQRELASLGDPIPIIFMTGHGDIPMAVRAMKAGAVEFLPKPVRDQDLLDAIQKAIELNTRAIQQKSKANALRNRYRNAYAARAGSDEPGGERHAKQTDFS